MSKSPPNQQEIESYESMLDSMINEFENLPETAEIAKGLRSGLSDLQEKLTTSFPDVEWANF